MSNDINAKLQAVINDSDNTIQPYHEATLREAQDVITELLTAVGEALPLLNVFWSGDVPTVVRVRAAIAKAKGLA